MNYYNENDKKAAAWLRVLIDQGSIPNGKVDERNIQDVTSGDLSGYNQCHFFAGIGGWSLALKLAGVPDSVRLWTASCPCQPFSAAGEGKGVEDDRHLWPVFFGLARKQRPQLILGEQVAQAIGFNWLDGISADLEAEGYVVGAVVLGAHSVGAPHKRQRLYWMAHDPSQRLDRGWGMQGPAGRGEFETGGINSVDESAGAGREVREHAHGELPRGGSGEGCPAGGMVFADGAGRKPRKPSGAGDGYRHPVEPAGGDLFTLGDVQQPGLEGRAGDGENGSQSGRNDQGEERSVAATGTWDESRIIRCGNGKSRRIPLERSFFPLAPGFPGRVAILKGFGNAVVPPLAAEFICAGFEAIGLQGSI